MAELVLLSLNRRAFDALYKRAHRGDEQALKELDVLWDGYKGQSVACFICDKEIGHPFATICLPEHKMADAIIAAPLCEVCADLPSGTKWHRALKMLKAMAKRKDGKQTHYSFHHVHRH
jgi:hypothetical protein